MVFAPGDTVVGILRQNLTGGVHLPACTQAYKEAITVNFCPSADVAHGTLIGWRSLELSGSIGSRGKIQVAGTIYSVRKEWGRTGSGAQEAIPPSLAGSRSRPRRSLDES